MTAVHDERTATESETGDSAAAEPLLNHRDDEIELIPPDSLTAKLTGMYTFLPINGAAFVMQVMHPVIGDVVGKYSVFRTDPVGRAIGWAVRPGRPTPSCAGPRGGWWPWKRAHDSASSINRYRCAMPKESTSAR